MEKTLVIHPQDPTTDFLSAIYAGKGWTVITEPISNSKMRNVLTEYDRIVMLGHGTPYGLLGFGRFMIEPNHVQFLRGKEVVAIWCHADQFVEKYGLKGFYTGMFISEEAEAVYEGVYGVSAAEIEQSNTSFAKAVSFHINKPTMLQDVIRDYQNHDSAVVVYNLNRLKYNL